MTTLYKNFLTGLIVMVSLALLGPRADAQTSSLYKVGWKEQVAATGTSVGLGDWYYQPPPPKKEFQVHDLVTIQVDEKSSTINEGSLERRKTGTFLSVLTDWVTLDGLKAIRPAPQANGDPAVGGTQKELLRSEATLETLESIKFVITAEVAAILPNGLLVLEGHTTITTNEETWDYSITGVCRADAIGPDNTVLSRDLAHKKMDFRPRGHISDTIHRGWFLRMMDRLHPF